MTVPTSSLTSKNPSHASDFTVTYIPSSSRSDVALVASLTTSSSAPAPLTPLAIVTSLPAVDAAAPTVADALASVNVPMLYTSTANPRKHQPVPQVSYSQLWRL